MTSAEAASSHFGQSLICGNMGFGILRANDAYFVAGDREAADRRSGARR